MQGGRGAAVLADDLATTIARTSEMVGRRVDIDGAGLLAERAAHTRHSRQGRTSVNGTTRLLPASDCWVSFTVNRADDEDLLAACFESAPNGSLWEFIRTQISSRSGAEVVERACLVGLSAARLGEYARPTGPLIAPFDGAGRGADQPLVVDLSSLWAGPLAANLLGLAGACVVKVEDPNRLDGARVGSPSFYDLLHGCHDSVTIDFTSPVGKDQIRSLLERADVVITSARPRAFEQLGIDPAVLMAEHPITLWASISAHGPDQPLRIGYGDDAAVAAGLCAWDHDDSPVFAADAIADPLTGLRVAALALDALATRRRARVSVALADVAAEAAALDPGDPLREPVVTAPRTRPTERRAATPGAHNERWLSRD